MSDDAVEKVPGPSETALRKRLCVVIVNYRTPQLVLDCIESLIDQLDDLNDCVVVVDNFSDDGSVNVISDAIEAKSWGKCVRLIEADGNRGFSAGNNIGIHSADADFYLLANSDTVFRAGALDELFVAAKENPGAGLIGPRLEWPDTEPQISCFRFHSPVYELISAAQTQAITSIFHRFDVPKPVSDHSSCCDWISFACVMVRREVFSSIGLLDEQYFMYYEDVDFCRRSRQAGFTIINWPGARVVHLRGQSSGVKKMESEARRLPAYYYRSRRRYYRTYYGGLGWVAANLLWTAGRAVSWVKELLLSRKRSVPAGKILDIWQA